MKNKLFTLLVLVFALSACGGASQGTQPQLCNGSDAVGDWQDTVTSDPLTLTSGCELTRTACSEVSSALHGFNNLYVLQTSGGAGCLTVGKHDCTTVYDENQDLLQLTCDGSVVGTFERL